MSWRWHTVWKASHRAVLLQKETAGVPYAWPLVLVVICICSDANRWHAACRKSL